MGESIRVLMITSEHFSLGPAGHTSPFIARQVEFLRRNGVDVDIFAFRGAKSPINYLKAWLKLRGKLKDGQYDLVHAQFGQSATLPWPKISPLVVTFRGSDVLGVKGDDGRTTVAGKFLRFVCRTVARRADAVILVSEHMRKSLPPDVQAHVIPSGLDFDSIPVLSQREARDRLELAQTDRLVLFVGNPQEARKRFHLTEQAMEILNKTLPAKLIVGWDMSHSEILLLMNACDVLIFTSFQEGSPNAVKEALACNLPVVSVNVADVPARLQGVKGCEICEDDRPETIASALERVLRRGGRTNGREVIKNLDEKLLTHKVISIYKSTISSNKV